jgi:hypothetical protein
VTPAYAYAEVLRVTGRYLAAQQARSFEIAERGEALALTWIADRGQTERRSYTRLELADLLAAARLLRGRGPSSSPSELEQALRTLGQELDRQRVSLGIIFQEPDGYRVRGERESLPFEAHFTAGELQELSAEQHARRVSPPDSALPDRSVHPDSRAAAALASERETSEADASADQAAPSADAPRRRPWWRWGRGR